MNPKQTTNKYFASNNRVFRKACELSGVMPTSRQASKFRNGKGLASSKKKLAISMIKVEDEGNLSSISDSVSK